MRRSAPFVICVCLFALSTGLTLAALARTAIHAPIPVQNRSAERAAANVDLVHRFYADASALLATGSGDLLDATVADDLTEHPARPGVASGRDGFVRALLALRATFPDVTLVVDDVRAAGTDQVFVRAHAEGAESGAFLGRAAPASLGQWGPLEVWRVADGQLAERWGGVDPVALQPLGQAPISTDTLGPGRRRMTVTRLTVESGAKMAVDNGQAIRIFAVDAGTLTVEMGMGSDGRVAVARDSALPAVDTTGTTNAVEAGGRVVTAPEADYTLANAGTTPVVALVVILSNTLGGEWPLNGAAAAASWSVAAMPEALGGALPSPMGFSSRVLAASVESEIPERSILALGWVFLAPGAMLAFPAGEGALLAAVDEGWVDLATTSGAPLARLASGEWTGIPVGAESLWQVREEGAATVLMLAFDQEETTQ